MTISDEAVEAAAKAAESCHDAWGTWEDVARAGLEAAAPLIQAEALEEAAGAWWLRDDVQDRYGPWAWLTARAARMKP